MNALTPKDLIGIGLVFVAIMILALGYRAWRIFSGIFLASRSNGRHTVSMKEPRR